MQGECLVNQEKAKAINNSMIHSTQEEGVFLVSGNSKHYPKSDYKVHIRKGLCSFAEFMHKKIPCKHMHVYVDLQYLTTFQIGHSTIYPYP